MLPRTALGRGSRWVSQESKNRKRAGDNGKREMAVEGWYGVGGKVGYSLILTPILSLKVKNQILTTIKLRKNKLSHRNVLSKVTVIHLLWYLSGELNNEQWSPAGEFGVPLPMKNCNLPFLFPLIKSKYTKSVIGNEKTRSLYKSSQSNDTRNQSQFVGL